MTSIELIRQKCIEANPTIHKTYPAEKIDGMPFPAQEYEREIRLPDVLLAMHKAAVDKGQHGFPRRYVGDYFITIQGEFIYWLGDEKGLEWQRASWNLHRDDLNEQSEETTNFLAELLK